MWLIKNPLTLLLIPIFNMISTAIACWKMSQRRRSVRVTDVGMEEGREYINAGRRCVWSSNKGFRIGPTNLWLV